MKTWNVEIKANPASILYSHFETHIGDRLEVSGGALIFVVDNLTEHKELGYSTVETKIVSGVGAGNWLTFEEIK